MNYQIVRRQELWRQGLYSSSARSQLLSLSPELTDTNLIRSLPSPPRVNRIRIVKIRIWIPTDSPQLNLLYSNYPLTTIFTLYTATCPPDSVQNIQITLSAHIQHHQTHHLVLGYTEPAVFFSLISSPLEQMLQVPLAPPKPRPLLSSPRGHGALD